MAGLSESEELELLTLEKQRAFASTPGGAAVGNPNMQRQGDRAITRTPGTVMADIVGAGAAGSVLGFGAPEILQAAGGALRQVPYPVAQTIGGGLATAGQALRGMRGQSAVSGAISGMAGETAGQIVDVMAPNTPVAGEAARFVGGGLTAETLNIGKYALQKYLVTPSLSLVSKMKKEVARSALEKLDNAPQSLTEQERAFIDEQIAAIRGGPKTDKPLESVGSIMGQRGQDLLDEGDRKLISAMQQSSQVGPIGAFGGKNNADIGTRLRDVITTRNQSAIDERAAQYAKTQEVRDLNVSLRENAGNFVQHQPAYYDLVDELKAQLVPGARSPSVQAGFKKILDDISIPEEKGAVSFQAIDDVRRKLGDAFRGKPAEGYDAIGATAAKDLYKKVSELQKKYAGPAQEKLLEDYHSATEGMQVFSSKAGKKATALDQFREDNYATDASTLPPFYFKSRGSVQALRELTGSNATVATAALEHADKELSGKTAPQVREWMSKNGEWLSEVRPVQMLVNKYATKLEDAERSMRNAQEFASQAVKDNALLTRNSLPAQRAVDLIKSGDTALWDKVTPAIVQSPQAKTQMVQAVRQVVSDQATAKGAVDLFQRNIRPFLEKSGIANADEMNFISKRLENIQGMNIPEPNKIGMVKTFLLGATSSWAASAASRGVVNLSIPSPNMIQHPLYETK